MFSLKVTEVWTMNDAWLSSFCFYNEEIFVKLDELDKLDSINHAWIGIKYSLTQAQNTFYCNG